MAGRFTHILVPTDFSGASAAALNCAKEIAQRFDARLSLLHVVADPRATGVWTPDVYVPASPEMRERFVADAQARLDALLTPEERRQFAASSVSVIGSASDVIEGFAREHGVDLIVMGTHGRKGLAHLFLGSVAERVVRGAPCPVLTTQAACDRGHEAPREATVVVGD